MIGCLESVPDAIACTGRQRVQTAAQQHWADDSGAGSTISARWLRCLQSFDFEVYEHTIKPAFATLGYVPVLPGPAALYRYKDFATGPMQVVIASGASCL